MDSDVVFQFGAAGEGFRTVTAAVRPLLGMTASVSRQLGGAAELTGTDGAAVGLLARVHPLVKRQLAGGEEASVAVRAGERPLAGVDQMVAV